MARPHAPHTLSSQQVLESRKGHHDNRRCCKTPPTRRRYSSRRASSRSWTMAVALALLTIGCDCGGKHSASALPSSSRGASAPSGGLTLRVRMPDGAVKRVKATAGETVDGIMSKIGMVGGGNGLSTQATGGGNVAEGSTSVGALGLRNGDFLYVKSDSAAKAAAKSKTDALNRMKATTTRARAREDKFVPFPDYARPPPPRATKRMKNWQDIEAMQAQTFSLKPQKDSNVKKISIEQSAMNNFVGYLKDTGLGKHRCALLFGRVSPGTKGVKVEAMYEPPQQNQRKGDDGTDASYDSSALTEAAKVAVAATSTGQEGSDATESCEAQSEAAADVARAVRVADLLGLRLVGWCLSHDKREHFMGATDVVTAAATQVMSMIQHGKDEGVFVATVTLPVNKTDGEVATEAFSVSNQTVQMFSEGIFAEDQPNPTADRVTTTSPVKEGGKETRSPDTLGLICNVAIVQHDGVLQTRFPAANRAKAASLSDLKETLFGAATTKKQKQTSFLKRISDFQLLVFLSRQMGFSRDFEELCILVRKRDGKSPTLGKLKVVLENLVDA